MPVPLIIGHRGASAVAPENTMAAFREAIAVGADGIEFDVRLASDGVPVVIHDSTLRRTGGVNQRVADLSWQELSKVDVGGWFRPGSFVNETVPSLRELFDLFQSNNASLYLEMKCDSPAEYRPLAEACCELINEYAFKERVVVECFELPALKILKEIDSEIKTAALFDRVFTEQ
ncbi:MAG TPA: glycerophosphodiester phosphodiesterase family protein, partial [Pyrinomonadaceae bacterium]|nr:glycerophosphodiester phosphodiesterase family protein [Pyrinomonadaceae bacterium]